MQMVTNGHVVTADRIAHANLAARARAIEELDPHPSCREDFPLLLRELRESRHRTRNALAKVVGCDTSYLSRIENGDREPPRVHILEALARELRLTTNERNRFFLAAGYAPWSVAACGWDPALQAVTDVLNNRAMSATDLEHFRAVLVSICAHWAAAE